MTPKLLAFQ